MAKNEGMKTGKNYWTKMSRRLMGEQNNSGDDLAAPCALLQRLKPKTSHITDISVDLTMMSCSPFVTGTLPFIPTFREPKRFWNLCIDSSCS